MDILQKIRSKASPRRTVGLDDDIIKDFIARDITLGTALAQALPVFNNLDPETTYKMDELELLREIRQGWCNFYSEDTVNPYIPLVAKGPWIITLHGAVIHDNGGYGMLGFGHNSEDILAVMSKPAVMANIMTPCLSQRRLLGAMRKEIGHKRPDRVCPYAKFILMNSGSEGNAVADRIIDVHTGLTVGDREHVWGVSLKDCFHGRTLKPAVISDSSATKYKSSKAYLLNKMKAEYNRHVAPNDVEGLIQIFEEAKRTNSFIEAVYIEAIMGEGNPGQRISPEFYSAARRLTLDNDSMLVIDSVQAGIRCYGVLSVVDYPGFETLPAPDFEVFSKAINGGQFPVSIIAMTDRAASYYKSGIYGNTMTTNPRACDVVSTVLGMLTDEVRRNVVEMGDYALTVFKKLQLRYPKAITNVTGTGLLYAVHLDPKIYPVVAVSGAEYRLRTRGVGVIHGGENALRFTPHFRVTRDEIDLQVRALEDFFRATGYLAPQMETIEAFQERSLSGLPESALLFIKGHLFDRMVVNDILTAIEKQGCVAHITRLRLGCSSEEETEMTIEIRADDNDRLKNGLKEIEQVSKSKGCDWCLTDFERERLRV